MALLGDGKLRDAARRGGRVPAAAGGRAGRVRPGRLRLFGRGRRGPGGRAAAAARNGAQAGTLSAKEQRELQKELSRLERQLDRLSEQEARLHAEMAAAATDYERLAELDAELREVVAQKETVEAEWLGIAERLEAG